MPSDNTRTTNSVQPHDEDGVDVSHLCGANVASIERELFDMFKAHFKLAVTNPSVTQFRLCVEAYDAFVDEFTKDMK